MMSKNILQSKTFWANIVSVLAVIAAGRGLEIDAATQAGIVAGVMAVVNIIMRLVSKDRVTLL